MIILTAAANRREMQQRRSGSRLDVPVCKYFHRRGRFGITGNYRYGGFGVSVPKK
ncbi:MAG: hypothetical protein K2N26_02890 [Oscillospiraceae bacterium]|nr:hypothetical protein [Oscillospiraceae bacterium]MDE7278656.1 hypothetical protein [Oscillospiraceae bacterium]